MLIEPTPLLSAEEFLPVEKFSEQKTDRQPSDSTGDSAQTTSSRALHSLRAIECLVASWHHSPQIFQQRNLHRVGYSQPILITPFDEETQQPTGPAMTAEGRDLSLGGISFSHDEHLPYRMVVITFTQDDGNRESVITKLNWCRFTREGHYQSGGKFLRLIEFAVEG